LSRRHTVTTSPAGITVASISRESVCCDMVEAAI
jgi:hypothetical protein